MRHFFIGTGESRFYCEAGMATKPGQFKNGKDSRRCMTGRKKCGRSQAIELVDEICGRTKNLKILKKKLQEVFNADPVLFFHEIIVPLRPKEAVDAALDPEVGFAAMTPAEACAEMDEATVGEKKC